MSFSYYNLKLRFINPLLATCPASANIMAEHVHEKNRKMIEKANSNRGKILKSLKKYVGDSATPEKEKQELIGVIRAQQELLAVREEIPEEFAALIKYSEELEDRINDKIQESDSSEVAKATVFMRDSEGHPVLSTHMILGFIKSTIATITNSTPKEEKASLVFRSKTSASESLSMDVKFVESFVKLSNQIMMKENGERDLCVRPLRFTNAMGKSVVALAASEQVPEGTEIECTMRIRKGSPLDNLESLKNVFVYGRNTGLGCWRSSSQKGSFNFKLSKLEDYKEVLPEGWE